MRADGHSPADIADELGVSETVVKNYLAQALAMLPPADLDQTRNLELHRLDTWLLALKPQLEHGNPDAVRTALLISQERSKLEGLYAAQRVEQTIIEMTEADRALQELIHEAKAQMKRTEASIIEAEVVDDGGPR